MNKIAIIGAGISGLSLAYYLKKHKPDFQVSVFEKDARCGGVIDSHFVHGHFFEKGPRTFPCARAKELLELIKELGLEEDILFSSEESKNRYLCYQGRLEKIPTTPKEILFSPLTKGLFSGLMRDLFAKRGGEDETIQAFFYRRIGKRLTDQLIDPMVLGIFAGDINTLSLLSTFPSLKRLEERYRSLTLGLLLKEKKKEKGGLFTLKRGLISLIEALVAHSNATLHLGEEVIGLEIREDKALLQTQKREALFDQVYITTPFHACQKLLPPCYSPYFAKIGSRSLTTVNMVYEGKKPLIAKGFGCLAPSKEKEPFLGITFDSELFKEQNSSQGEIRITAMLKGGDLTPEITAEKTAFKYLKINNLKHYFVNRYPETIAAPLPGHFTLMQNLQKALESTPIRLHGTYLTGPSITNCIKASYNMSF